MNTYDAMISTERLQLPSPIPIQTLLEGKVVESERVEFKKGWNPLGTLHTLCAFANDFHNLGGGYIFIGIAEKDGIAQLPPAGLDLHEIDAIQKEILRLGYEAMRPYYHPSVTHCQSHGASVLLLRANGGRTRPYKARVSLAKDGGGDWGYFIRKGPEPGKHRSPHAHCGWTCRGAAANQRRSAFLQCRAVALLPGYAN